jgi:hypothetical protein
MDAYNFFLTFVLGVFQIVVVGRILISPRIAARRNEAPVRVLLKDPRS